MTIQFQKIKVKEDPEIQLRAPFQFKKMTYFKPNVQLQKLKLNIVIDIQRETES